MILNDVLIKQFLKNCYNQKTLQFAVDYGYGYLLEEVEYENLIDGIYLCNRLLKMDITTEQREMAEQLKTKYQTKLNEKFLRNVEHTTD